MFGISRENRRFYLKISPSDRVFMRTTLEQLSRRKDFRSRSCDWFQPLRDQVCSKFHEPSVLFLSLSPPHAADRRSREVHGNVQVRPGEVW